jgi:tetratricopeptide (TPR) repeat protein
MHNISRGGTAVLSTALSTLLLVSGCSRGNGSMARGDELFQKKDYRAALVEYRQAGAKDPKSGLIRQKLAKTYEALDARDTAWREFVRAADLLPDDSEAQLDAAKALLETGQFEDARARAERVIAKDNRNVRAHTLRGLATAGMKDLDSAVKDVQKALELDPSRAGNYVNLGTLELARGRLAEGEAALKQAATIAPSEVGPQLALANFYWRSGRREETEKALKDAIARKPDDLAANRALALFYVVTNRADAAEGPLKVAAAHTDVHEAQLALADYYVGRNRPADAAVILKRLSSEPDAHMAAEARLAGIEYVQGNRDAAYSKLDSLLKQQPNNVQILLLKARWLVGESRKDEALATAKAAVAADPKSPAAHYLLGNVYAERQEITSAMAEYAEVLKINPRATPAQLELARLQLAIGKTNTAVEATSDILKANPGNLEARLALVQGLRTRGDLSRAEAELKPLLRAAPRAAAVQVEKGEIALRQKQFDAAAAAFDEALKLDSESLAAFAGRVNVDLSAHRTQEALRRLDARVARAGKNAPVLAYAGRAYAIAGNLPRGETVLEQAITADPGYMPSYHYLGQIYVRQHRLDDARQRYEDIAKRHADNIAAHTMVGMILQVQNRPDEARARYEKILQIDPRAVVAANNLAYMKAESGTDLDIALQLAQTAKASQPDDPDVNDTLGWVYYKKGMAPLAIDPLRQSVEHTPANPVYRYHLGMAYLKTGDKEKAREMLQQALKLDPRFDGAADARRALDGLGS